MSWKDRLSKLLPPRAGPDEPAQGGTEFDAGRELRRQSEQAARRYRELRASKLASLTRVIAAEHASYNARLREVNYQRRMQGLKPIRWGALTELPTPPPMPGVLMDVQQQDEP